MTHPIHAHISALVPNQLPRFNDADLEFLAGVTADDLMALAFPVETPVRVHDRTPQETERPAWAWSKQSDGVLFVLSPRSYGSRECILIRVPEAQVEAAESALIGGWVENWYRLVRTLPPDAMQGWYPTHDQGLAALHRVQADPVAIEKMLSSIGVHAQILRASAETIGGLALRVMELLPTEGTIKLAAVLDPKSLDSAREEARHARSLQQPRRFDADPDRSEDAA